MDRIERVLRGYAAPAREGRDHPAHANRGAPGTGLGHRPAPLLVSRERVGALDRELGGLGRAYHYSLLAMGSFRTAGVQRFEELGAVALELRRADAGHLE